MSSPPSPLAIATRLGSVSHADVALPATSATTSFGFIFAADANGYAWDVGSSKPHFNGDNKTYVFDDTTNPVNFPEIAAFLTNGINDPIALASADKAVNGPASSNVYMEAAAFGKSTDFIGNKVDSLHLVVQDVHIYATGGGALEFANYTWEVWGFAVPIWFTPPTDADGAYVFERNTETVSVVLASAANSVVLTWDTNSTPMVGSGTSWQLTVSNIANGVHQFQVFAPGTGSQSELRQVTFGYGLWSQNAIAPSTGPGIALDASGTPHICYQDAAGKIIYAVRTTSGWVNQIVTSAVTGGACGIALDKEGRAHLLFGRLQHAFFNGATWVIDTIDVNGIASQASIALNPKTDLPTVAYRDTLSTHRYLVVANRTSSGWTHSIADRNGNTGLQPSLAVDANGVPNVAYFDSTGFARYVNISVSQNKWDEEIIRGPAGYIKVDPATALGGVGRIAIALNSTGRPFVVIPGGGPLFGTIGYPGTWYAYWTHGAMTWTVDHMFLPGPVQAVSLAMDASNQPHIAFSVVGSPPPSSGVLTDLGYASLEGTSWNITYLSHVVTSGSLALVLTPLGAPIIAAGLTAGPSGSGLYLFASLRADHQAPVTTASLAGTLGTGGFYTSPVTVTLGATDDLSGVASTSYKLDSAAFAAYTAPVVVATDGNHTVQFYSTDASGNREATKSVSFKMALGGPPTTATLSGTHGTAGWYVSTVQVTLNANGGPSGVQSIHYRIDNGTWQTYALPFLVGEGVHSVDYYAVNNAGSQGSQSTSYINVDTTAPTVATHLSGTGNGGWYRSPVVLNLSATDALSGAALISVSVNGGPRNVTQGSTRSQTFSQDGITSVSYFATDRAGNAGVPKTVAVQIDRAPPSTSAQVLGTSGTSGWYTSNVSVELTATDPLSGVASIAYRVDNGSWQTYVAAISLHEGTHTVEYNATDILGNAEASHSLTVRVDTTAPVIGITSPIGLVTKSQVNVVWTGSDATSGIVGYAISVDGGAFIVLGMVTNATVGLADGAHTITIRATDAAGNQGLQQTSVTVNTGATVTPQGPGIGWQLGIVAAAIIAIVVAALVVARRRTRKQPPPPPGAGPKP